jgi:dipeptidyl aminopeptidase/acylaminoacyl peptidase
LSKPTLIFHGTADGVVPVKQSEDLRDKLTLLNVKNELVKYPTGHELFDASNTPLILDKIETWFRENIN